MNVVECTVAVFHQIFWHENKFSSIKYPLHISSVLLRNVCSVVYEIYTYTNILSGVNKCVIEIVHERFHSNFETCMNMNLI